MKRETTDKPWFVLYFKLYNVWQNMSFPWPIYSRISAESEMTRIRENSRCGIFWAILVECHISIAPENVRKSKVFWRFQGV